MKKETQKLEDCLDSLQKMSKGQLLEEMEQLLLTLSEKGTDLQKLSEFYKKGGLYQQF